MHESSYFSTSLSAMVVINNSNRCGMVSPCFNLHDDIWCGTFSHMLIYHLYIFFVMCLFRSFPVLKNKIVSFLIVEF